MATERKTTERRKTETGAAALRRRVAELSAMLGEAEAALSAIRGGEVDAVAVSTPAGNAVRTLVHREVGIANAVEARPGAVARCAGLSGRAGETVVEEQVLAEFLLRRKI